MRIGLVGNGKHAQRIKKILNKKKLKFFLYKPNKPNYFNNNNFKRLKDCKIIFILSPNNTHFYYLKKLWKGRYIFCEKPPVLSNSEIKYLKKIAKSRIYFNFNFRFSILSKILSDIKKYKLGKLLYSNINLTHGHALTDEYKKNWRSKKSQNKLGILEMVLIHYLDLLNYYFKIKKPRVYLKKYSSLGSSYDTCKINTVDKNNANIDLFASYSSPFYRNTILLFKNGYISQNEKEISVMGPAINLNKKNMFIKPKLIKKVKINYLKDYQSSLEESINFFLNTVRKNKKFNIKLFNKSLESNYLMINFWQSPF